VRGFWRVGHRDLLLMGFAGDAIKSAPLARTSRP
jgi:hypothetical protein